MIRSVQYIKMGKNYYCKVYNIVITINSFNYCIIIAHLMKKNFNNKQLNTVKCTYFYKKVKVIKKRV